MWGKKDWTGDVENTNSRHTLWLMAYAFPSTDVDVSSAAADTHGAHATVSLNKSVHRTAQDIVKTWLKGSCIVI